ncbi:hypothetical protein [uncultured Psychrobacter sp.]|uniref:hypothetical protein n=1 Tax=uncultured Psychrobacter sp. TaxID=259303 RepID=UPI0026068BE2|nr:hypothetical protein [uncultured Psychrobacter sp.]
MNTVIEFFDEDPIENLITCINYQFDKVLYFGHKDSMTQERVRITRDSLKRICNVTEVEFIELSKKSLDRVVEILEREINEEKKQRNQCFFDLTGGEGLILVAMGILSTKYETPMHRYDIWSGELTVFGNKEGLRIDETVPSKEVKLSLDDMIAMWDGVINYRQQKMAKSHLEEKEFIADFEKIWSVAGRDAKKWNTFSGIFKRFAGDENENLTVTAPVKELDKCIRQYGALTRRGAIAMLHELNDLGILEHVKTDNEKLRYKFKNAIVKECLLDAGCALELHTYYEMKNSGRYSDCRVGVHIDWDGKIGGKEQDVINEIDVLALEGYIPVFISCKNGKVNQMALYELDAVASRFGGRYVRKEMRAGQELSEAYANRAREMQIEVRYD